MWSDPVETERLKKLLESADTSATEIINQAAQAQTDIAKEKTQYFEKIALGSGATIAAVVSFIGSHSGRLKPPYLLRSALVTLIATMVGSMYRNWRYPYYINGVWLVNEYQATRRREQRRADFFEAVPVNSMQTGMPIDGAKWAADHEKTDRILEKKIKEFTEGRDNAWKAVSRAERITLGQRLSA